MPPRKALRRSASHPFLRSVDLINDLFMPDIETVTFLIRKTLVRGGKHGTDYYSVFGRFTGRHKYALGILAP